MDRNGGRRRREPASEPPVLRDRIGHRTAARTRRLITFLLGLWCGGLLLVAIVAPTSFSAAETVMRIPPPALEKVLEAVGPAAAREVLRYQVGEVNRLVFGVWGWLQLAASAAVLLLLVFLSNAGKAAVGVAGAMVALAALMNFFLIPRIALMTRMAALTAEARARADAGMFAVLHGGFALLQVVLLALMGVLLFLLFRSRTGSRNGR